MSLVWKYRRGKIWYLAYAGELNRPSRSLKISDGRLAETIRAKEESDLLLSKHGIKYHPRRSIIYSQFIQLFLDHKRAMSRSPATIDAYGYALNNFGASLGSDIKTHKITAEMIERFIARRYEQGRKPKTVWNEIVALKVAFEWAAKEGFTAVSPCQDLQLPKRVKHPPDYLREDEYLKLAKKFPKDPFLDVINFYILTGCRRDEGRLIVPSQHIDWKRRVLFITQPKQSDFRTFPISSELHAVMKRLIVAAKGQDRLIPYTGDHLTKRVKKMFTEAGLRHSLHFHSLRHTFGTWLGGLGAGQKNLQFLMGHTDSASTNIYVHGVENALREEIRKLLLPKPKTKKPLAHHLHR